MTRLAYQRQHCDSKVDRVRSRRQKIDCEKDTQSLSQALPTRLHRGAGWPTMCMAEADTTGRFISLIGSPKHCIIDPIRACLSLLKCCNAFEVLHCRLKVDK